MAVKQADTVPPPPGEDDVYSAATRVGQLPQELLDMLRKEKEAAGEPDSPPPPEEEVRPAEPDPSAERRSSDSIPDVGAPDAENTEPSFDRPFRFIKKSEASPERPGQEAPESTPLPAPIALDAIPAPAALDKMAVARLLLVAALVVVGVAALILWLLG